MALSLKNPKVEQLARDLARETGESLTNVVMIALEERVERIKGRRTAPQTLESILEIATRCSSLPDRDTRDTDSILQYDDHGLFGA